MFNLMHLSTYDIKLSDGPRLKTLDQVHAEGMVMQCLLPGDVSLCSKGHYHQAHRRMKLSMYFLFVTSSGRPSRLKQSSSFTRNPIPTLSSVVRVRRPTNLHRSYLRVAGPTVNCNYRHSLRPSDVRVELFSFHRYFSFHGFHALVGCDRAEER